MNSNIHAKHTCGCHVLVGCKHSPSSSCRHEMMGVYYKQSVNFMRWATTDEQGFYVNNKSRLVSISSVSISAYGGCNQTVFWSPCTGRPLVFWPRKFLGEWYELGEFLFRFVRRFFALLWSRSGRGRCDCSARLSSLFSWHLGHNSVTEKITPQ